MSLRMSINDKKKEKKEKNIDEEESKQDTDDKTKEEEEIPLGTPIEEVRKNYPALYQEIVGGTKKYNFSHRVVEEDTEEHYSEEEEEEYIDENEENVFITEESEQEGGQADETVEGETESGTEPKIVEKDYLEGFDPKAIDFIRRCKSAKEALEIINYLERRQELGTDEAKKLRQQLETQGLESFGVHKDDGFYFKMVQERKLQDKMHLHKRSLSQKNAEENEESQDINDSEDGEDY